MKKYQKSEKQNLELLKNQLNEIISNFKTVEGINTSILDDLSYVIEEFIDGDRCETFDGVFPEFEFDEIEI